jgi:hypothetical protein
MNRPNLAELLKAAVQKANQEQADAKQVGRITAAVKAPLKHIRGSDDDDLVCPSCGYKGSEADFEPDDDGDSDGFRTDSVTGESGDPDNEGDRPAEYDNRLKALKAKYAGRNLTVVDRILINRGIDPFTDN